MNLTPQQNLAFEKFQQLKVGALFMQMGTGKTRVALELVKATPGVDLLLYVCPNSIKKNVSDEIEKWEYNKNYIIYSYETIARSDRKYLELLTMLEEYKNIFIIADESIFIKSFNTKTYDRMKNIRKICNYALILNGTPVVKNEWDLYNQMNFLSPKIINMNYNQFRNTFFRKITYKKSGQPERYFYEFSDVNSDVLTKLIEPYIFKADLEFDKNISENRRYIPINDEEYILEKEMFLERAKEEFDLSKIYQLLSTLNYIASTDINKCKAVQNYIENKKVIVYCNYIKEVDFYQNCYKINGGTPTEERNEIIEKFKNDTKPLIMTYGVGSVGLNLQFCNEIVYSSINFNFGLLEQSKYRIKRLGQEKDIKYTYILPDVGITKMIEKNISNKETLDSLIKNKIKEGEVEKWVKNL